MLLNLLLGEKTGPGSFTDTSEALELKAEVEKLTKEATASLANGK